MTTARDIIKSALRKIHVLGVGSTLTAEEAADGLSTLNAMIATWSVDLSTIYTESKDDYALTANDGEYTIGSAGADFTSDRVLDVLYATVLYADLDYPLQVESQGERAAIWDKNQTGIPQYIYYDENYPIGNIALWPVPVEAMTLSLYTRKPLDTFSNLTTDFTMPPEYQAALEYNLAVWIAPEYEKEAADTVKMLANETLGALKIQNTRNDKHVMDSDDMLVSQGRYNIYSDQ